MLIAELCLPLGEHDGVGIDVPVEFHSADQNIQRGLWLSQHLLQQKKKFHSTVPIIILSGNLDCDTIAMLETIGIPQSDRWKKPAEFDAFMKTILGLTAQK